VIQKEDFELANISPSSFQASGENHLPVGMVKVQFNLMDSG